MPIADNEQALCEALIRILEEGLDAKRSDVTYPEIDHSGPPVEIRLRLGARRFAIEHTLIEPFPRAIQTGKEFQALIGKIEADLSGSMAPPGTYRLVFPIHRTQGKHRRTHAALRERIVQWVREVGAELHAECPERLGRDWLPHGYRGVRTTEIEGIPLSLSVESYLPADWPPAARYVVQKDGRLRVQGISKVELADRFSGASRPWAESFPSRSDLPGKIARLLSLVSAWQMPHELIEPPYLPPFLRRQPS